MKTLFATIVAIFMLAMPASAVELINGVNLDTKVVAEYNITQNTYSIDTNLNLNYDYEQFTVWGDVNFDLVNRTMSDFGLGVDVNLNAAKLYLKTTVSPQGTFGDVVVGTSVSF